MLGDGQRMRSCESTSLEVSQTSSADAYGNHVLSNHELNGERVAMVRHGWVLLSSAFNRAFSCGNKFNKEKSKEGVHSGK